MHTAPTVTYPVGRSRAHAMAFAVVWLLVAVATVAFLLGDGASPLSLSAAMVALLVFAAAWRQYRAAAVGRLAWDGVTWWWMPAGGSRVEGRLTPCLDLQSAVLVHFAGPTGRGRWLWLEHASAGVFWGRLRCALMQPPSAQEVSASAMGASARRSS